MSMSRSGRNALGRVFNEILEDDEGVARNSALIFFKLFEMGSSSIKDMEKATGIHHTTCSTCLKSLRELGIVESGRVAKKRGRQKRVLEYRATDNWENVLGDAVSKAGEDLQGDLADAVASLRGMKEMPPVFAFETLARGPRLTDHQLLAGRRKTIELYRQATKSIMIMSREFGWVEEALPTLHYTLRSNPNINVRLLISWKTTSKEARNELEKLRTDFPRNYDHKGYDAGIFRMSIVDRTKAILIKRALPGETILSEGIAYTEDGEFVSQLLVDYFELKFENAEVIPKR